MNTKILNGKKISLKILKTLKKKVKLEIYNYHRPPGLAIILIGNKPESLLYISNKKKAGNFVGFYIQYYIFNISISEDKVLKKIQELNKNINIDGIIIQLPIPKHLNILTIFRHISPKKDVECFHPYNIGLSYLKNSSFRSCTPRGIITLLEHYQINIKGFNALIISSSITVGRPMFLELLHKGCTITIAHKFTKNILKFTKISDLIIIAIGKPNFLLGQWIKKGAIIIDVGINYLKNKKIVGDVHYKTVSLKTSYITPVPGGIGPMTVAALLQNTFEAFQKQKKN
ncbi:bifunctional methylenetetrahydrofolate dehydrogenase/methenyltetrahydrofolate cyclohydrolase FolD [Buchnera aphidicola]|uniref:Bifunctional protein FolD n=1 Tax=Buchnera aphidicola subsp. Tuberolachnus salignus TaxID=98804 RepID=A0A160SX62_BUCTT|nr:bifunctional methylenetetrahydrofolate dehydrogenase/methenyltetrahydrofolate cyclohydrolase FolD [Buchnera aphidicola]CUR53288.1 Bifunctional protein FolD [Buchnera aphidicola (Tuberolachnus salignus)]